jgi:anhydro-N-acetylmuramic acid kinase
MKSNPTNELYLGIMSGTSLDGIDICLVQFDTEFSLLKSSTLPFSDSLQDKIKTLTKSGNNEIERMAAAELIVTNEYAIAVKSLLKQANINADQITAIGVHGQTIRHIPATENTPGYSLQLVDGSRLAVATGIPVCSDFRRKDIALGGQGAPLVPAFHQYCFSSPTENRVIVNIGGIANISTLPCDQSLQIGFDTGPGNTLLDNWFQKHQQGRFDSNGDWARTGNVHKKLLSELLSDPYFMRTAPKSTGPEYFNLNWLDNYLSKNEKISPEDIQATLTELTAITIAQAIQTSIPKAEVFVCGGGTHNHFLIECLESHLNATTQNTECFGIHPDDVEAVAFAWLAKQRIHLLPGNLPSATGASRAAILGGLYIP